MSVGYVFRQGLVAVPLPIGTTGGERVTITARRAPAEKRPPRPAVSAKSGASARGRASDEQSYLYRIIQTISAGPDLETILRGTVGLLTEATGCHACFVYFVEGDRLVLRAASNVYAHLEGTVSLPADKGLAGWVASSRRSAFIKENALEDPRVVYIPEMEEERFQSMVSVPVLARAGDVIGVINLHTEAPREFDRNDLEFIEHTASLVAGAIENARLYQDATRRVAMLTELSRLSQGIALAAGVDALLDIVTTGCQSAIDARAGGDLPGRPRRSPPAPLGRPRPRRRPGAGARDGRRSTTWSSRPVAPPGAEAQRLAERLWGPAPGGVPRFAPLPIGDGPPGLLGVLCRAQATGAGQRRLGGGLPRRRGAQAPRPRQPAAGGERRQGLLRGAVPGRTATPRPSSRRPPDSASSSTTRSSSSTPCRGPAGRRSAAAPPTGKPGHGCPPGPT